MFLVSKQSLKEVCSIVFAEPVDRFCVLKITIKDKTLRLNGFYAPNDYSEQITFLTTPRRLPLAGDWNAFLGPDIERLRPGSGTN